jgi:hypothetical protein
MLLFDVSAASAGLAAIAIVKASDGGVRLVAAPELMALPQVELLQLLVAGASALLTAAEGLGVKAAAASA